MPAVSKLKISASVAGTCPFHSHVCDWRRIRVLELNEYVDETDASAA